MAAGRRTAPKPIIWTIIAAGVVVMLIVGGVAAWRLVHGKRSNPLSDERAIAKETSIVGFTRVAEFYEQGAVAFLVGPSMTNSELRNAMSLRDAVFAATDISDVNYVGVAQTHLTSADGMPCSVFLEKAAPTLFDPRWRLDTQQLAAFRSGSLLVIRLVVYCGTG